MAKVTHHDNGSISVNRTDAFVEAIDNRSAFDLPNFGEFIREIEEGIREEHEGVTRGALNNSRGEWYETLIALAANEFARTEGTEFALVRLPNVNIFSCENLYQAEIATLISDLRATLREEADVSLISSNPDFVVVSAALLDLPDISDVDSSVLDKVNSLYASLEGAARFDEIIGYCSVKSGLRPDRRLQIAHEGSLMKALYRHIQTRLWAIDAPGIRYFGIAGACGEADREALKTVATHSIVDVLGKPESAVDELFQVNTPEELRVTLKQILAPKNLGKN
ncbi:Cfr10I/Bse634I family restriction endonuclease [Erythrobacter sp. SCSIO 43205]|uniref:Cfr10I/Bse634I family restriction endonuclease n=1 Tax=Erythrobacter sp. SCSIO 43205 TaxID=2779361 RepID=UPI001CA90E72|nr:Cfr10I/Bse634I family restriction endonuclease [Erythrobacter sp. SCSIO 43205]UAB77339.1 Cfr10I/Bse634I family restriction endonuclease [Erythrobacter sp. SCSIO 43205]